MVQDDKVVFRDDAVQLVQVAVQDYRLSASAVHRVVPTA